MPFATAFSIFTNWNLITEFPSDIRVSSIAPNAFWSICAVKIEISAIVMIPNRVRVMAVRALILPVLTAQARAGCRHGAYVVRPWLRKAQCLAVEIFRQIYNLIEKGKNLENIPIVYSNLLQNFQNIWLELLFFKIYLLDNHQNQYC